MSDRIKLYQSSNSGGAVYRTCAFHCPGCGHDHMFTIANTHEPIWQWNGSLATPTFTPSLLCNKDMPQLRCHSFVTLGKIQFLNDCWHELKGQTVDLPYWDEES